MSATPRTDAALKECQGQWGYPLADLARQLERELAEARKIAFPTLNNAVLRLERELAEAREIAQTQALMLAKLDAGTADLPWTTSSANDKNHE